MRRNMSGNLGLYKYLWPGSVCVYIYMCMYRGGEYAVNSHFGCLLLTANYLLLTAKI